MIPTSKIRFILCLSGALLWLIAIGMLAWGFWYTPTEPTKPQTKTALTAKQQKALLEKKTKAELPSLKEFEKVLSRNLRQPLYDPPSVTEKNVTQEKKANTATPPFELLGTMIEKGHSAAIFSVPQQGLVVCRVGDILGPENKSVTVEKIEMDSVEVQMNDRIFSIKLKDENHY